MSLAFHPRLYRVASSSDDHSLIIWDTTNGRALNRSFAEVGEKGLAFSPDDSLIACSTSRNFGDHARDLHWNPTLRRLLDAENRSERRRFSGHLSSVRSLAIDRTGTRLASGDYKSMVIVWDVTSGRILRRQVVGSLSVESVVFVDDDRRLLFGLELGDIALLDLERPDTLPRVVPVPGGFSNLTVDRRMNRVFIGGSKGSLAALSLPDLEVVQCFAGAHDGRIVSLARSPDGQLLAMSGMDRRVVLRDASTLKALATFPGWTGVVRDLSFDAMGRWLGLVGSDSDVCLWDLKMVQTELAELGLAWDQFAPATTTPGDRDSVPVP